MNFLRVLVSATLLMLAGCRDPLAQGPPSGGPVFGDARIGSALSVVPAATSLMTKSSFTGDAGTVSDWTLLQFDAATGLLAAVYYQPSGADMQAISVVTGRAYDWYAVANVGDVRSQFLPGVTRENAMAVWTAAGLTMNGATGLPMSWQAAGVGFSRADLEAGRKLAVSMTRLVARYDLRVEKSALTRYAFTVTGATIEGPVQVRAFATGKGTEAVVSTDAATASDVVLLNRGDAASFYAAENCYGSLPIGEPDAKKPANLSPDDHPTYVEISGTATLLDGSGLTFPTKYRFYLGQDATSNFDVVRNTENTVVLHLTDAKIDAALGERDAIDAGETPVPLWKIEIGPYSDTRSLQFEHGAAAGGAGIRLPAGGTVAEGITRLPAALSYRFRLDQALYDAGIRVYRDAAATLPVLPASGYSEAVWVEPEGSPATLYFTCPAGAVTSSGQAHIRTLDGRKSDELSLCIDHTLERLEIVPSRIYAPGIPTVRTDRTFKLYAWYSDGSSGDITTDDAVTWTPEAPYESYYNKIFAGSITGWMQKWQQGGAFYILQLTGGSFLDGYRVYQLQNHGISQNNYSFSAPFPLVGGALFTASYTLNGVTCTATVSTTLEDTRTVVSVTVSPSVASVDVGGSIQFRAVARYDTGDEADVTAQATWTSADSGRAVSSGGGRFRGAGAGETTVTATFNGVSGTASLTVAEVPEEEHEYTHELLLSTHNPQTESWEVIRAESGGNLSLAYNEVLVLYAVQLTFDHGVFAFMTDVSDEARWQISDALSDVGTWNASLQTYTANNDSGSARSGSITASYDELSASRDVQVAAYEAPYLQIEESGLVWDCWEYDSSAAKTFHVSSNGRWTLLNTDSHWHFSRTSGNGDAVITVYPLSQNVGSDLTASVRVTATGDASLGDSLDLLHEGVEGSGASKIWWTVDLTPSAQTLSVGETFDRFTTELVGYRDGARTQEVFRMDISDVTIYEVSDPSVAAVISIYHASNTGEVTGLSAGTATVTAWWGYSSAVPMNYRDGYPVEIPGTATLTVTDSTPLVSYSSFRIVADPEEIACDGSAELKAYVTKHESGPGGVDLVEDIDVTSSTRFSLTAGESYARLSGTVVTGTNTTASVQAVTVRGVYEGSLPLSGGTAGTAGIVVGAAAPVLALSVGSDALAWAWDESGSGSGQSFTIASNAPWTISGFGSDWSVLPSSGSGDATVTVYPKTDNDSVTSDRTCTLTVSGGGLTAAVSLTQHHRPAPALTGLSFDRSQYLLVRVESGVVSLSHPFTLTARYSDGSEADVTAAAAYADEGSLVVDGTSGLLTATAACNRKVLTASFGGRSVTARYSADDLEVPVDLRGVHFESQEDKEREFLIDSFEADLRCVLSGSTRTEDVTAQVTYVTDGLVVADPALPLLFHFTGAGSGSVAFSYSCNGVTFTRLLEVNCSATNHITYSWQ